MENRRIIMLAITVGTDRCGRKLFVGDICLFKAQLGESMHELKGMIIYDEDTYSFAFTTLDNYLPIILMGCVELGSIEKLYEGNQSNFQNMPNGARWKKIYNSYMML
jgi:hypothetical protein